MNCFLFLSVLVLFYVTFVSGYAYTDTTLSTLPTLPQPNKKAQFRRGNIETTALTSFGHVQKSFMKSMLVSRNIRSITKQQGNRKCHIHVSKVEGKEQYYLTCAIKLD